MTDQGHRQVLDEGLDSLVHLVERDHALVFTQPIGRPCVDGHHIGQSREDLVGAAAQDAEGLSVAICLRDEAAGVVVRASRAWARRR